MTRKEIKEYIINTIKKYRKEKGWKQPVGSTYHYEIGQVVGMVKAFKKMGLLEANDQLSGEIADELF